MLIVSTLFALFAFSPFVFLIFKNTNNSVTDKQDFQTVEK